MGASQPVEPGGRVKIAVDQQAVSKQLTKLAYHLEDSDTASGFLSVKGSTDLILTIGGVGEVDLGKPNNGNPAITNAKAVEKHQTEIDAGASNAYIALSPYYTTEYQIGSFNETDDRSVISSEPYFDNKISIRVISDFGDFKAYFPPTKEGQPRLRDRDRLKNKISIPYDNVLYSSTGKGGRMSLAAYVKFGMKFKFWFTRRGPGGDFELDLPQYVQSLTQG
ncbi:chitinase [Colletotrichum tofieldiae]|nr:chitinase [Colletotrichum tofieldiae]GKT70692.1 chitinase [Colletotrichum tofieldiae]GKT94415.1 chitinase [Colletotrichum tofieldiae]